MKRFLPYFKYLRPVRLALIAGILCGVIYGAAGGLGVPLMIKYVFPRVLLPDQPPAPGAAPAKHHFIDIDRVFQRLLPLPAAPSPAPSSAAAVVAPAPTPA